MNNKEVNIECNLDDAVISYPELLHAMQETYKEGELLEFVTQGQRSSKDNLVVFDEAVGIDSEVWESTRDLFMHPSAKWINLLAPIDTQANINKKRNNLVFEALYGGVYSITKVQDEISISINDINKFGILLESEAGRSLIMEKIKDVIDNSSTSKSQIDPQSTNRVERYLDKVTNFPAVYSGALDSESGKNITPEDMVLVGSPNPPQNYSLQNNYSAMGFIDLGPYEQGSLITECNLPSNPGCLDLSLSNKGYGSTIITATAGQGTPTNGNSTNRVTIDIAASNAGIPYIVDNNWTTRTKAYAKNNDDYEKNTKISKLESLFNCSSDKCKGYLEDVNWDLDKAKQLMLDCREIYK